MITIETTRTAGATQDIAAKYLGYTPGVSAAGRLGVEITFADPGKETLDALCSHLRRSGNRVYTTRNK